MQAHTGTRKRRAPGTSPIPQQQPADQSDFQLPPNTLNLNDQYRTQLGNEAFSNATFDPSFFSSGLSGGQPQTYPTSTEPIPTSTSLVRRDTNSQLVPKAQTIPQEQWVNTGQESEWMGDMKEEDPDLGTRAALAKKDAQTKRKQIPPFVLKLWRLVDAELRDRALG